MKKYILLTLTIGTIVHASDNQELVKPECVEDGCGWMDYKGVQNDIREDSDWLFSDSESGLVNTKDRLNGLIVILQNNFVGQRGKQKNSIPEDIVKTGNYCIFPKPNLTLEQQCEQYKSYNPKILYGMLGSTSLAQIACYIRQCNDDNNALFWEVFNRPLSKLINQTQSYE